MPKMSRDKGKTGEREVVKVLHQHGFTDARRTGHHQVHKVGGDQQQLAADVECRSLGGVHFEVKRKERFGIYSAMEQATHDAGCCPDGNEKVPIVVFRKNRGRWYACLPFEDLLLLLKGEGV